MPLSEIQSFLLANAGFRERFRAMVLRSVSQQLDALAVDESIAELPPTDWQYMLFCASLLTHSKDESGLDAALRIAQTCISSPETTRLHRDSAAMILDALTNRRAIELAQSRDMLQPNLPGRLPMMALLDWYRREWTQTLTLPGDRQVYVNAFQLAFWNMAQTNRWVSLSAPTSAGKSYIIEQFLVDQLDARNDACVVYLVPTRALIHQVERDIRSYVAHAGIDSVNVSTLPVREAFVAEERNVFVFTQERLHIFLAALDSTPLVNLLIIDEAQKVADGSRGVLLQQAIERVVEGNPDCQVLLSSAMTRNPQTLLKDAPEGATTAPLDAESVTVNQNLLWLSQRPGKTTDWYVDLCINGGPTRLGKIALEHRPVPESKRLTFVAHAICGTQGGAMVYVNGAAAAEKAAEQVYDLLPSVESGSEDHRALADLIELVQETIHRDYSLAHVLQRGVGFHYGNMPLLVRDEIERLFREGYIKYLCCTSTLIEGVNLPCRHMFVRGPKKGNGRPMQPADFWNLAGRAGRWGKEFEGNIVCVDARKHHVWNGPAPTERTKYEIRRTTDDVLGDPAEFLEFLNAGAPLKELAGHPEWESVFSYLVTTCLKHGTLANAPTLSHIDQSLRMQLQGAIAPLCDGLRVDQSVVLKNPGISPIAMDQLLQHFEQYQGDPDDLLPADPASDDAVDQYAALLATLDAHFKPEFGGEMRRLALSIIVVHWMRGWPLKQIIGARLKNLRNRGMAINLQAEIRSTMADVEQYARFHVPRYLSCYSSVLRQYLLSIDRADLVEQLLDVSLLLEFGVSARTPLSLMGLGLSRTSAIALFEIIADDDMTEDECKVWLSRYDVTASSLPALVRREIGDLQDSLR